MQSAPSQPRPCVLADLPVSAVLQELLGDRAQLVAWDAATSGPRISAIYTYGHPTVNADLLDMFLDHFEPKESE